MCIRDRNSTADVGTNYLKLECHNVYSSKRVNQKNARGSTCVVPRYCNVAVAVVCNHSLQSDLSTGVLNILKEGKSSTPYTEVPKKSLFKEAKVACTSEASCYAWHSLDGWHRRHLSFTSRVTPYRALGKQLSQEKRKHLANDKQERHIPLQNLHTWDKSRSITHVWITIDTIDLDHLDAVSAGIIYCAGYARYRPSPGKRALDHADHTAPIRQHQLDHTYQMSAVKDLGGEVGISYRSYSSSVQCCENTVYCLPQIEAHLHNHDVRRNHLWMAVDEALRSAAIRRDSSRRNSAR